MGKVQIRKTPLAVYVDGRECFIAPGGRMKFNGSYESVIDYIAEVERGYPLEPDEKVVQIDRDFTNIDPSNLRVFKREPGESGKAFQTRIWKALGWYKVSPKSIQQYIRIPDLETRPTTKGPAWPLKRQIFCLQQIVSNRLKEGYDIADVKDIAQLNIRRRFFDVRMSDLLFGDEPKRPRSYYDELAGK